MRVLDLSVNKYWKHPSFSNFKTEESLIKIRSIGKGAFSKVYKVRRLLDSSIYALKLAEKGSDYEILKNEFKMIKFLNQKEDEEGVNYLVRMFAAFYLEDKMALLEPLYQGDLKVLVTSEKGLPIKRTLEIMVRVFEILIFLEKHGVIHRDIKLENVFITERGEIRLGDFGAAILKEKSCPVKGLAGSPHYISPEYCVNSNLCDYATDVWSAAVLFCSVYLGDMRMFRGKEIPDIFLNHQIRMRQPYPESLVKHMTIDLKESLLWEFEETSDLTFEEVLRSFFDSKKEKEVSLEDLDFGSKSAEKEVESVLNEIKDLIEFREFSGFLKELFEFDPDKRLTSKKALSEFERVFGSRQKKS